MRDEILDRLASDKHTDTEEVARKRRQLNERRQRLRDLYEFGDLGRAEYAAKSEAIDAELDGLAPGPTPDLDGARSVLEDFGRFWQQEQDPEPRRELVQQLFARVWVDGQKIVAVHPTPPFTGLFASGSALAPPREAAGALSGSDGTRTRTFNLRRLRGNPALESVPVGVPQWPH